MRKIILPILAIVCLSSCEEQTESNEDRLKNFYTYYLSECKPGKTSEKISSDTLEKYCTASFLQNVVNDTDLDYDPILSSPNCDRSWAKTVTIYQGSSGRSKIYRVSFLIDKAMHSQNLEITMGKEGGFWKIDYVKDLK